eukprot:gene19184-21106_t
MARSTLKYEDTVGKIWCIVTQPDDSCLSLKLREDAKGQDLLDAVCERLGIVESDYFGFQFTNNRGEIFWLNMRNRIARQVQKPEPFSLLFCVKFYIQPHQLLQSSTRRQFYLNVKRDLDAGKYKPDRARSVRIQALIAQAMDGDFRENHIAYNPPKTEHWPCEFRQAVIVEHCQLSGMPIEPAEYRCLTEIAQLEDYGIEYHHARSEENRPLTIGVGFEALKITKLHDSAVERIPYSCLHMATHNAKCVRLDVYVDEQGHMEAVQYRMNSKESACALYRSITEHHAFFRCDSIGAAVKEQVSKDFFDTFRNLFNDENNLEQNYIFDTRRTCREAYDHARRILFNFGSSTVRHMDKESSRKGVQRQANFNSDTMWTHGIPNVTDTSSGGSEK